MNRLYEYMNRRLAATSCSFHRYCYESINWDSYMLGLVGPCGVGKMTLILICMFTLLALLFLASRKVKLT